MAGRISREEILTVAIQLFSAAGYSGVSMRDIAKACHLNVGSLYHHFSDKQQLHMAATQQVFAGRSGRLLAALESSESPREQLKRLIDVLCQLLDEDQTFLRLVQRELLDGDEIRLKYLAEQVFGELTATLNRLCRQLNPSFDPGLLTHTIIGTILQLFHAAPLRQHLPGFQPEHLQPEVISQHVQKLLFTGIDHTHSRGSL